MSLEWYEKQIAIQMGQCAICKRVSPDSNTLCVDHDHMTGKVRGLLCVLCNHAMAAVDMFPEWASDAINYQKSFKDAQS